MKGFKLLLSAVVLPLAFYAFEACSAPVQKRESVRKQPTQEQTTNRKSNTLSRTINQREKSNNQASARVAERKKANSIVNRSASIPQNTSTQRIVNRTQQNTLQPRGAAISALQAQHTAKQSVTLRTAPATLITRNASKTPANAASVLSRNYSKCREVFNSCMDEFCANKDTELRRCACSVRHKEFKNKKAELDAVEDKLLDFSQRLLTVNMDKEDALAITQATEGELAYNTEDNSASKKLLDEISKKLNTSFNDSNFDQNLNVISLSLNADATFDNIDSLEAANTTTKIGTALYSAALPICREMAAEVCSIDELSIAESSYQLSIEQDCNTIAKTYQTQIDQARAKVMESGALLDMSRLDIYQKRNSDDMLACKTKMLNMLTNDAICGAELYKCLDTTGHFINPATGQAFLTEDLYLLQETIVSPTGDLTWQTVPANTSFVTFLNTKKEYLAPTMENCQNFSADVWNNFLDEALAKIKQAQNAKLNEIRQSCVTLIAECVDETSKTISDFDSRALSIFGISADSTANQMCNDVRLSCSALINNMDGNTDWSDGIIDVMASKSYDSILQTCRTIGENCFVQTCTSTSSKYELCSTQKSVNRGALLNREICWNEVLSCIDKTGVETLKNIQAAHPLVNGSFYEETYGFIPTQVYNLCQSDCAGNKSNSLQCYKCRIAERIWGNCEYEPNRLVNNKNKILIPANNDTGTLLSWLANNTETINENNSCYVNTSEN